MISNDLLLWIYHIFHLRRKLCLSLRWLLLDFHVKPYTFDSSQVHNLWYEIRDISNCFLSINSHLNPLISLVIDQEKRNKFTAICLVFIHLLKMSHMTNIFSNIMYGICLLSSRIILCTFTTVSRVLHDENQSKIFYHLQIPSHLWNLDYHKIDCHRKVVKT